MLTLSLISSSEYIYIHTRFLYTTKYISWAIVFQVERFLQTQAQHPKALATKVICSNRDISPISQSDQFLELRMDLTIVSRLCRSPESLTVPVPSPSPQTPFWGNSLIHLSKLRGCSNFSQSKMIDQLFDIRYPQDVHGKQGEERRDFF